MIQCTSDQASQDQVSVIIGKAEIRIIEVEEEKGLTGKNSEIMKLDTEINLIEMTVDCTGKNLKVVESMTEVRQEKISEDPDQILDQEAKVVKPDL